MQQFASCVECQLISNQQTINGEQKSRYRLNIITMTAKVFLLFCFWNYLREKSNIAVSNIWGLPVN
jgi:hypothetical protein